MISIPIISNETALLTNHKIRLDWKDTPSVHDFRHTEEKSGVFKRVACCLPDLQED